MGKNVQRTITMSQDSWDYLDSIRAPMNRTPSQELEYSLKVLQEYRDKNDRQALFMAEERSPRRKKRQSPESDAS